jgi:hypothetical protein
MVTRLLICIFNLRDSGGLSYISQYLGGFFLFYFFYFIIVILFSHLSEK